MTINSSDIRIAVIGMGYVGLPLAVEFGKVFTTFGYDINADRILELRDGEDSTLELTSKELSDAKKLIYTSEIEDLKKANVYIVTVPTPIDKNKQPDLTPLINASIALGSVINQGDTVVYESTVFPGATEEICVPVLEKRSGLVMNIDFYVGYSPERINPGDKNHGVKSIVKVTSGSNPETSNFVDELYSSIISAGTFKASSIKVAEAAKVIENSQRDINIAFVNELAKIFNLLEIDTQEVLDAAGTKWNFLPFKPGLVGGHCIGVDPYYLAQKAQEVGYNPEIILAGRRLNDGMGQYVASELVKGLIKSGTKVKGSKVLLLGITFKENCPDIRNTRVIDIIDELNEYSLQIDVYDPWADKAEVKDEFGIDLVDAPSNDYEGVILAVSHHQFTNEEPNSFLKNEGGFIYDVKGFWPKEKVTNRL